MPALTVLSDIQLLELLRCDSKPAFEELYSRYWRKLFTVAANKTGSPEEAEEIVQDIFIMLWQRRNSISIETSLSAYLAVSVKYRVLKILAKRHLIQKYADYNLNFLERSINSTEEWIEFEELRTSLENLVGKLPEKCRLVYRLSREEGFSQKEIAKEFNISEKTVEAHIGKALKTLRTGLTQMLL